MDTSRNLRIEITVGPETTLEEYTVCFVIVYPLQTTVIDRLNVLQESVKFISGTPFFNPSSSFMSLDPANTAFLTGIQNVKHTIINNFKFDI